MTDAPELDLRAELARIDRDRAETEKLQEESRKFAAEQHKLRLEADKYFAETRKFDREYRWFPWLQLALTTVAAIAAVSAALVAHFRG